MSSVSPGGEAWGCYVHVPWCRAQCPYCGFYVVAGAGAPAWAPYVGRVVAEHAERSLAYPGPAATVYLGGGTPSRLPAEALAGLLGAIPRAEGAEVSAEANPEDVSDAWLEGALAAGVNRLSLGVQSFDPAVAGRLGRAHTSRQESEAMARVAARMGARLGSGGLRSWSIDLIFAVPGQSLEQLDADLDRIVGMGAPHVSIYGLTIEPETAFSRAHARGRLPEVGEDLWRAMYDRIVERLGQAGIHRYEVSNFAREGHRCAHNRLYWSDRAYLGLGPGAHSYAPDGTRTLNAPDLAGYLAGTAPREVERPDPRQRAGDLLVSGLRGIEGLSRDRLRSRTGLDVAEDARQQLVALGVLQDHGDRLVLTGPGFPMADGVARRLLDTLLPAGDGVSGGPGRSG